jgi:hypothetical protein
MRTEPWVRAVLPNTTQLSNFADLLLQASAVIPEGVSEQQDPQQQTNASGCALAEGTPGARVVVEESTSLDAAIEALAHRGDGSRVEREIPISIQCATDQTARHARTLLSAAGARGISTGVSPVR